MRVDPEERARPRRGAKPATLLPLLSDVIVCPLCVRESVRVESGAGSEHEERDASRVCERVERERGRLQPAALEHALEAAWVGGWCGGHRGIVAPRTRTVWDDGSTQRSWAHVLQPAHSSIARDGTFCVQSCVLRVDCVDCVCCAIKCEICWQLQSYENGGLHGQRAHTPLRTGELDNARAARL